MSGSVHETDWFRRFPTGGGTVYARSGVTDLTGDVAETVTPGWRERPTVQCLRCERVRPHAGRGLCHSCHVLTGLDGTRDQYPRSVRRREDVVEDYTFLREQGADDHEIAQRLGMRVDKLRQMVRPRPVPPSNGEDLT